MLGWEFMPDCELMPNCKLMPVCELLPDYELIPDCELMLDCEFRPRTVNLGRKARLYCEFISVTSKREQKASFTLFTNDKKFRKNDLINLFIINR